MEEKRRFYRIDDSVFLSYKPLNDTSLDEAIARARATAGRRQNALRALGEVDARIATLVPALQSQQPEVAEVVGLLADKVNLLADMVHRELVGVDYGVGHDETGDRAGLRPTHNISLSAGGVSFRAPDSVRIHDCLELSMTLFPEYYYIKAFGRVIGCRDALPTTPQFNKLVAVDFVYIDEQDQEYIVSHVLKKQSELLRGGKVST